jgi:hypothetical protein
MNAKHRIAAAVCTLVTAFILAACGGGGCSVGKPCGDTCIAENLTCHK